MPGRRCRDGTEAPAGEEEAAFSGNAARIKMPEQRNALSSAGRSDRRCSNQTVRYHKEGRSGPTPNKLASKTRSGSCPTHQVSMGKAATVQGAALL